MLTAAEELERRRQLLRIVFIVLIVATSPFYCLGFYLWATAPDPVRQEATQPPATTLQVTFTPSSTWTPVFFPTGFPTLLPTPIQFQPPINLPPTVFFPATQIFIPSATFAPTLTFAPVNTQFVPPTLPPASDTPFRVPTATDIPPVATDVPPPASSTPSDGGILLPPTDTPSP